MKKYRITYLDGYYKEVYAYSMIQALGMVDGQDFIRELKLIA